MAYRWRRFALLTVAAALAAALNITPAFAQGGYYGGSMSGSGNGGYMSGSGTMPYQAPSSGSGYGAPPTRAPSRSYRAPSGGYGSSYAGNYKPSKVYALFRLRRGDTLARIARLFGTSIAALLQANPMIFNPNLIFAGQTLMIPLYPTRNGSYSYNPGGYGAAAPPPGYGMMNPAMPPMGMPGQPATMPPPSAPPPGGMPPPGAQAVTINLVAANLAFNMSTISVPAGARVTVNFANQDSGVPHNFAVYTDSSAQQALFRGQIVMGPAMTTYTFTAPSQPGTYFFRCDVHFTMMTGQFVVR